MPKINKNIAWLNRYSSIGSRGSGKTQTINHLLLYHLKKFLALQQATRTKNPYHRPWENYYNNGYILFPKQKHKIIIKIICFLYRKFVNEERFIINKPINCKLLETDDFLDRENKRRKDNDSKPTN